MSILIYFITFLIMIVAYALGCVAFLGEKTTVASIGLGSIVYLVAGAGYYFFHLELPYSLFLAFWTFVILIILFRAFTIRKIWNILKIIFFIELCEEAVEMAIDFTLVYKKGLTISSEYIFLLGNICLLLLSVISVIVRLKKNKYSKKNMNLLVTIGLIVLLISLIFTIASLKYAQPYIDNVSFYNSSSIFIILGYLGIAFLGLFIIFTRKANDNYKQMLDTEITLRILQKNNYNLMLEKEEETRRFRHDLQNHIICIKSLLENKKLDIAKEYIGQMQEEMLRIQKMNYVTGNDIVDAILNYHLSTVSDDVAILVDGQCAENLGIHYVEICSIVSNAIQNAVEAVNCQKDGIKKIIIKMKADSNVYTMKVWNTCDAKEKYHKKGIYKTSKKNQNNHGIGLKNIRRTIEKNQGSIQIREDRGGFLIVLQLPLNANG